MNNYKEEFIKFMYESKVLTFGEFTLKSGRIAPYFINTGNYKKGSQIKKLGHFYAQCIKENNLKANVLFGPAYKGIPLCVTTSIALSTMEVETNYCFNRKEEKDHGEGGSLVGHKITDGDKVLIIEDVITAGTAIRETLPIFEQYKNLSIEGIVISVDRMEKGVGETSAVEEIFKTYGIKVYPIVTINDIINALETGVIKGKEYIDSMKNYRKKYGINITY